MPDKHRLDHENGILEIRSYGSLTRKEMETSISKAMQVNNDIGIDKVLIDTTGLESLPSIIDIYETLSAVPREISYALIVDKERATTDDIMFGAAVSTNRGRRIMVFSDRSKASDWLKGGRKTTT